MDIPVPNFDLRWAYNIFTGLVKPQMLFVRLKDDLQYIGRGMATDDVVVQSLPVYPSTQPIAPCIPSPIYKVMAKCKYQFYDRR